MMYILYIRWWMHKSYREKNYREVKAREGSKSEREREIREKNSLTFDVSSHNWYKQILPLFVYKLQIQANRKVHTKEENCQAHVSHRYYYFGIRFRIHRYIQMIRIYCIWICLPCRQGELKEGRNTKNIRKS